MLDEEEGKPMEIEEEKPAEVEEEKEAMQEELKETAAAEKEPLWRTLWKVPQILPFENTPSLPNDAEVFEPPPSPPPRSFLLRAVSNVSSEPTIAGDKTSNTSASTGTSCLSLSCLEAASATGSTEASLVPADDTFACLTADNLEEAYLQKIRDALEDSTYGVQSEVVESAATVSKAHEAFQEETDASLAELFGKAFGGHVKEIDTQSREIFKATSAPAKVGDVQEEEHLQAEGVELQSVGPKPQAKAKAAATHELGAKAKASPKAKAKSLPGAQPKAKAEPKAKAKAKAKEGPNPKAKAEPKPKAKTEASAKAAVAAKKKKADAEAKAKPKAKSRLTKTESAPGRLGVLDDSPKTPLSRSRTFNDNDNDNDNELISSPLRNMYPFGNNNNFLAREPTESSEEEELGSDAFLHVYDLHKATKMALLPIYHLGVEVYGSELCFGVEGLVWCPPGGMTGHVHKKVIPLGRTPLTFDRMQQIVWKLNGLWPGSEYKLLTHNCQTFAVVFCAALKLRPDCIPADLRRFASITKNDREMMMDFSDSRRMMKTS